MKKITKEWLLTHGVCVDHFDVYHLGKKLKPHTDRNGYIQYLFSHNSTHYSISAHVLMYTWFIQDIPEGYQIHHKDNNRSNNDIKNLEMLTPEEHYDRHIGQTGKNMTFKAEMPKKKVYTIEYLDYKIETFKLAYEKARKNRTDKKAIHAAASNYWVWVNKKKQFLGEL